MVSRVQKIIGLRKNLAAAILSDNPHQYEKARRIYAKTAAANFGIYKDLNLPKEPGVTIPFKKFFQLLGRKYKISQEEKQLAILVQQEQARLLKLEDLPEKIRLTADYNYHFADNHTKNRKLYKHKDGIRQELSNLEGDVFSKSIAVIAPNGKIEKVVSIKENIKNGKFDCYVFDNSNPDKSSKHFWSKYISKSAIKPSKKPGAAYEKTIRIEQNNEPAIKHTVLLDETLLPLKQI